MGDRERLPVQSQKDHFIDDPPGASLVDAHLGREAECWDRDQQGCAPKKIAGSTKHAWWMPSVRHPSGAVIPGASVVVTNTATGLRSQLKANQDGYYQASFLPPGSYQVDAVAQGFKKAIRETVEVRVADRLEINFALEIGASEQSVNPRE